MTFAVTIDGPAAAGKGTIARELAKHFGFAYLDTGLLYRAVGRRVLAGEDGVEAAENLTPDDLTSDDLRSAQVAQAASQAAANPEVRNRLLQFQRDFAKREGGAVLDGRDIGTVICPDAEVKIFVTASDQVRAERRYFELLVGDPKITLQEVLQDLKIRDERDRSRTTAPLRAAADAVVLDTSDMSIPDALEKAISIVKTKR